MKRTDNIFRTLLAENGDGLAKSRRGALGYSYISSFITNMVTMTYFVGLMLEMGASDAYISAVTVVISAIAFLQFLSPLLLERMKKRKPFLMVTRGVYHFLYIVLLGIIPLLKVEKSLMLGLFFAVVIIANTVNALTQSGLSVWQIQSLPEGIRSDFFTVAQVGAQVLNAVCGFLASRMVDVFASDGITLFEISPTMFAFLVLRVITLAFAVVELVCLYAMKEQPYSDVSDEKEKTGFRMLLSPIKNARYMRTICVYIIYCFISAMIGKYFQIYLLEYANMSYTYISLSGIISLPIVLILSPVWAKLLRKLSWARVMPIALIGVATGYFFNTLITENTQYFHIFCSVFYSSFSVAITIIFAFLPFVSMPDENRTAYQGFFMISGSAASLLGNLAGIIFMSLAGGVEYYFLGLKITGYQTLNLIQTVLFVLLSIYSALALPRLSNTESEDLKKRSET